MVGVIGSSLFSNCEIVVSFNAHDTDNSQRHPMKTLKIV